MAESDAPVSTEQGIAPLPPHILALRALLDASNKLGEARQKHAESFLLAKISSRKPTDRQAEASAEVEKGPALIAAETLYFIAKAQYAAALGLKGV